MAKLTAKTADKHVLYEKSVQNSEFDAEFVFRTFTKLRKRKPVSLKEDFCGTFNFCCEWIKLNKTNTAIGVDIDAPTIEWGYKNNAAKLDDSQNKRIHIFNDNVLNVIKPKVDIVTAFNFSYFLFKKREELKQYFITAYKSLNSDGLLFLDIFGGSESYVEQQERRKLSGFTYVWDHAKFYPITSEAECKIHFEFPDGTAIQNAFVYTWRLWTPVEVRELLDEAGFKDVIIYWEGTDKKTGKGNGIFREAKKGDPCQSWIAYIVAVK